MATGNALMAEESADGPLTKKKIGELFARGEVAWQKIILREPTDLLQIESTGVVVDTRERDYVLIVGDRVRIAKIRAMGFELQEPAEKDYKRRVFRIWIRTKGDYLRLREVVSDVLPTSNFPAFVGGLASDAELKWASEAGMAIERCESFKCN
jgi:hypothetical protein